MDSSRLEKLINLTTSENDHEALSALRTAHKLADGNLWRALTNVPKIVSAGTESGRIKALEIELNAVRRHLKAVQQDLAEAKDRLTQKPVVTAGNFDLRNHLDRPGYYEIYYELSLEDYIRTLRIIGSSNHDHWQAVTSLKFRFENSLGLDTSTTTLRRFSQLFSKILGIPSVKGGGKKQVTGFLLTVEKMNSHDTTSKI